MRSDAFLAFWIQTVCDDWTSTPISCHGILEAIAAMIISARAFTVVIASAILMTSSILAATACDDKLALNNQHQHDHKAKAEAPHDSQQQAL